MLHHDIYIVKLEKKTVAIPFIYIIQLDRISQNISATIREVTIVIFVSGNMYPRGITVDNL